MFAVAKDFVARDGEPHTMSVCKGEKVCVLEKTNEAWWLVANQNGGVGFVPTSYMDGTVTSSNDVIIKSIDEAISKIYISSKGKLSADQESLLFKLNEHKDEVSKKRKRKAPPVPCRAVNQTSQPIREQEESSGPIRGQEESSRPIRGQEESSRPIRGQEESSRPIRGQKESSGPIRGQEESSGPIRGQKESSGPIRGQEESSRPIRGQEESSRPIRGQEESSGPIRGQKESSGPIRGQKESSGPIRGQEESSGPIRGQEESSGPIRGQKESSGPIRGQEIPENLGEDLLHLVTSTTNITKRESKEIVVSLLSLIANQVPTLDGAMHNIISTLPMLAAEPDDEVAKLGLAFANLCEIKNDAQQRNWAVQDDENDIVEILNQILTLTSTLDTKYIPLLRHNDNNALMTIANYYQMEPKVRIRLILLQIIGAICSISPKFISVFVTSVLPEELVREVTDHARSDKMRVAYCCVVLSLLFSTGEPVPVAYDETIGESFVKYLMDIIEDGTVGEDGSHEDLDDVMIRVILSINLHHVSPDANPTLNVIAARGGSTRLSEKLMLLFNRGHDPVNEGCDPVNEGHDPTSCDQPPNSVLKFFQDIFARRDTGDCFLYTNDLMVLIDIIVRNIADLSSGSKGRTEYLDLLLKVAGTSSFIETRHRCRDLFQILNRIKNEELPHDDSFRKLNNAESQ
nr:NCK-interacting protein with SH3 domain-like [Ciona intestinalis]|eukprot:XP_026695884.1 NCK-interacting protein with SH3 domain-like [Ciona intestinalis]